MNIIAIKNFIGDVMNSFAGYAALLGIISEIMGAIAAFLSVIWFGVRFYEYFKKKRLFDEDKV